MGLRTQDEDTVSLRPCTLTMKQSVDMNLFLITSYNLSYTNITSDEQMISMKILLKRKIMSEMMTTYFPSLLLMMITYATTFFKPFFFEAALSVNLTTMLVMTTIFISKMEGLPPTSDIKMIDYWLILCQLVPFAQVVLLTAMEFLREEEQSENHALEGEGRNPEEPQTVAPMKHPRTSFLPVLAVIGMSLLLRYWTTVDSSLNRFSFREEGDAHHCALCFLRLLWNCCNFLFLRISSNLQCLQILQAKTVCSFKWTN